MIKVVLAFAGLSAVAGAAVLAPADVPEPSRDGPALTPAEVAPDQLVGHCSTVRLQRTVYSDAVEDCPNGFPAPHLVR